MDVESQPNAEAAAALGEAVTQPQEAGPSHILAETVPGDSPEPAESPRASDDGQPSSPEATESSAESYAEGFRGLGERFRIFFITSISITLDLAFLTGWVALIKADQYLFNLIGKLPGVGDIVRNILEVFFDSATLLVIAAFIAHDLYQSVRRIWKKR